MFEPEAALQKDAQLDKNSNKSQDAFMKATAAAPLSSFSLPPNLNDKLVSNKQKQASTATRPRLSNLRSIWLSQQSFEQDAFADDKIIDISLPPISPARVKSTAVLRQISVLATVATLLCLSSAAYPTLKPNATFLDSVLLGGWVLLFVWFMLGDSIVCFRYSTIVMLVVTGWSHNETKLLLLLSCVLFYIGERLSIACQHLQTEMSQQQMNQQTAAQQAIDRALDDYNERRALFLSTVSQEIRDAALMAMATLEQFSPSSILCNTHELLSACSIAVPIASISAINTTIKQACHISSHLNLMDRLLREADSRHILPKHESVKSDVSQDFDMGELMQNVGDALAGMSAKLGVHFVIYHTDNGLYYPNVVGDEDAIRHALINLLRNILEGCTPGACIQLGLYIASIPDTPKVKVTFNIVQIVSPAIPDGVSGALIPNANFTAQLLGYIGGKMEIQDLGKNKTRVQVSLELYPGCNSDQKLLLIDKPSQILEKQLSNIRFSIEPTLQDLSVFISNLKGVKIILHAPEQSIFAKHLTSCLTSWNTDICHLPVLLGFNAEEEDPLQQSDVDSEISSVGSQQPLKTPLSASNRSIGSDISKKVPSPAIQEDHIHSIPPTFILIDDDITTLEKKLQEFRDRPLTEKNHQHHHQHHHHPPPPSQPRRHRRSKSRQGATTTESLSGYGTVAIVFFTCLANYKRVRDTIHYFSSLSQAPLLPRVVVVPKPAGPRRFLTALHTAWNNAVVEPQFIPIATSPLSPFIHSAGSMNHFHFSPGDHSGSNSTNSMTPGIATQPPLMTPHDMSRFSPGRRTFTRGLQSPSNLQMESDRGNYFFDPSRPSAPNVAVKSNTSPILSATAAAATANNTMVSSPVTMPTSNINTPASCSSTGSSVGSNATPTEIKRRLRSHSSTFMAPTERRTLVDLSQSPTPLPGDTTCPVTKTTEQDEPDVIASPSRIVKSSDVFTENSTSTTSGRSEQSSTESPVMPTHAQILATLDNNASSKVAARSLPPSPCPLPAAPAPAPATLPIAPRILDTASILPLASSPPSATIPATTTPKAKTTPAPPTQSESIFNFKFSNRQKRKEKANSSSGNQSPPITVLIVEDNMINQAILSTWMKKHRIKFSVASDGKEAVEKWKGGGFHLILMDIQLPVMDGIAATKMIRSIEKERKIGVLPSKALFSAVVDDDILTNIEEASFTKNEDTPTPSLFQSPVIIVALTASSLESDRQAALAAGCNDFLTKPVSLAWLEKKIMEWGCMQALIDFEGWRKWKRSADAATKTTTTTTTQAGLALGPSMTNKSTLHEKEMLALRTEEMLKDGSKAIILVGMHKKRMSTFANRSSNSFFDDRSRTGSSSQSSTPPLQQQQQQQQLSLQLHTTSSASPTKSTFYHARLRKRASDPDLYTPELSIPKQVQARDHRRILEQEKLLQQWEDDSSSNSEQ